MKKILCSVLLIAGFSGLLPQTTKAQSIADCITQLTLNYQKLASLKNILNQMYTGYQVLNKGYNAVKGVAQGNFNLHEVFLDGLYLVSPAVRKYPRVSDIISDQAALVSEYRKASGEFNRSGHFNPEELSYMMAVYDHLADASLKNISDLAMIMTNSQMRMSDAERLTAIDRIFLDSRTQLSYLRKFNSDAGRLAQQRAVALGEKQIVQSLYGINP
ncbi:TerB family tellurite resistance protein [Mucilaginibacter defluvii]|uniref:TerB family tellurite resistance protein n=1 Tax=Mucilaginibacter defluvii TaxID=1196019 RepID=UPI0017CA2A03|nr:TerB family tellurite resistance protein [Bacteroidota bacterium]